MTDKDVFISRLRHAAAVRVVPPRRAIVAVDAMPPRVLFAIDTEGVDAFETALAAVGGTVHRAADLNVARALGTALGVAVTAMGLHLAGVFHWVGPQVVLAVLAICSIGLGATTLKRPPRPQRATPRSTSER